MRDFRKVVAWQKADDLVVKIYQITQSFPADERFGLTSQTRRAAISVAANIAEGCGRDTLLDFRRFLFQAKGSLSEVDYYLHLSGRLGYIQGPVHTEIVALCQETGRVLQGLIGSVDEQLAAGRKTN